MSAKILMGLSSSSEKKKKRDQLEKQIGCMAGIFQVFDRHHHHLHLLTGKKFTASHHTHKNLPSGQSHFSSSTYDEHSTASSPQIFLDCSTTKSSMEIRRVSVDSSPSLSSSLECRKVSRAEISDTEYKSTRSDLRDVVKDSINVEARSLSMRTSVKGDAKKCKVLKPIDSPRPCLHVDLNDSLRVLVSFRESPSPWNNTPSEAPRFSCDGREISRSKSSTKLRELPRLSLDSRESSSRNSNERVHSVVARLMGLDAMPSSTFQEPTMDPVKINNNKANDPFCGDGAKDRKAMISLGGAYNAREMKNTGSIKTNESVYSQLERSAKELEFLQSQNDFKGLKHILEPMQAKERENRQTRVTSQMNLNTRSANRKYPDVTATTTSASSAVAMKAVKSSTMKLEHLEGLSGLRKLQTSNAASRKKANYDQKPKATSPRDPSSEQKSEDITIQMPRSPRPKQSVRERGSISMKPSSSSTSRVHERKLELEKKPRPEARRRQNAKKALSLKPSQTHNKNDHLGKEREDEIHQMEDRNTRSLAAQVDAEATNDDFLRGMKYPFYKQGMHKVPNDEDSLTTEQPSPISVLDASFYQDDMPLSPIKTISFAIKDDELHAFSNDCSANLLETATSKLNFEIHIQKLNNIMILVKKLGLLGPTGNKECQDTDLDYLSRILLASGLLLKDNNTGNILATTYWPKSTMERVHQNLISDAVEEILARKLVSVSHGLQTDLLIQPHELGGQLLPKELCSEIKQLLVERPRDTRLDDEDLIFREDLLRRSNEWNDFGIEVPGLVLEIEKSLFRDLIDEIVVGEVVSGSLAKASWRRRELFHVF